ncbi:NADH-quinone oxidoreductase subunit NuoG [Caldinitratiruptor microaerophilus]|uniref:NADH-quinone oxidoreductase n=1 Tax=Caldinitratiruptor microaerophilus TaxID=671077 RepID=A0AA35CJ70_9FIRM|nr:NADH-quinone oxidoreductase subunit NuoG [Caldinitratiruptor microaerophilus]BDG59454.1 NADH-quinone oxidoreductase [Caldinitratiruptor microaerophilus]
MSQERVTVTIDGRTVQVPKGTLIIHAARQAGVEIPFFCYHPQMEPAGVCRMCLVQVEKMPKPVTACNTPVADGMVVYTQNDNVKGYQEGVLEFLLLHHPLDCPVCDKGGECQLQDLTFAYGKGTSRLLDPKQHKPKAVNLGPFIVLDEERCILCRRCVRYDDEIAVENQLVIEERGHDNLITTAAGLPYEHPFTGNVIDMCPVGALTSDLYRFKSRPWDLSKVESVCTGCSLACRVRLDFRHGRLLRVVTVDATNEGQWICDRGRFGYQYVHSGERVTQPLVRRDGRLVPVTWGEALAEAARRLGEIQAAHGAGAIGFIGGGRLTIEEAYLLQKFARAVVGTNNVDHRVTGQVTAGLAAFPGRLADLRDADVYLLVDVLPAEKAPVMDLPIRQALRRRRARLVSIGPATPKYRYRHGRIAVRPGQTAAVLEALARAVRGQVPAGVPEGVAPEAVEETAKLLTGARKIAAVWGGEGAAAGKALLGLLQALHSPKDGRTVHLLIPGEQNQSRAAAAAGVLPGYLPGFRSVQAGPTRDAVQRLWGRPVPQAAGLDTGAMLAAAARGELKALYLVGANPALTWPDGRLAREALERADLVIVHELFLTETARMAHIVFPAAPFTAKAGHYAALDGEVRPQAPAAQQAGGQAQPDGAILAALAREMGVAFKAGPREVAAELEQLLGGIRPGAVLPGAPAEILDRPFYEAPEAGAGEAGHTLAVVPVDRLFAGGGTVAFDEGVARVANRAQALLHPDDLARLGLAEGAPVRLEAGGEAIELTAVADDRVIPGTVQVPRHLPEAPVNRLGPGARVTVSRAAVEVTA